MPELGELSLVVNQDLQFGEGTELAIEAQDAIGLTPFEVDETPQAGMLQTARIALTGLAETVGRTIESTTEAIANKRRGGLAFAVGSVIGIIAPAAIADNVKHEASRGATATAHVDSRRAKVNNACPPGHLKLSLVGPTTIIANQPTHYVLDVQDCKTARPTTMKNVKIQEQVTTQPLPKNWTIRKIRDGATVQEGFNATLPGNPTAVGGPPSTNEETFTYTATRGRKVLTGVMTNVNVQSPPGNLLSAITPTLPTTPTPGVYLAGPSTVQLNTPYTYTVEIDEAQTYKNVRFEYNIPSSSASTPFSIPEIVANTPWIKTFTAKFTSASEIDTRGIELQGGYLRPGIGYKQLFDNNYPITLASGIGNTPQSPNTTPPPLAPNQPL